MMVNIHDAETHFSKIIQKALKGEEVIIAKDGKPLVRLVPFLEKNQPRKGGQLNGLIKFSDDFDAPLPEYLLNQFYGDRK